MKSALLGLVVAVGMVGCTPVDSCVESCALQVDRYEPVNVRDNVAYLVLAYTSGVTTPLWHSQVQDGTVVNTQQFGNRTQYTWTDIYGRDHVFSQTEGISILVVQEYCRLEKVVEY